MMVVFPHVVSVSAQNLVGWLGVYQVSDSVSNVGRPLGGDFSDFP
jgi:hypothetical protein